MSIFYPSLRIVSFEVADFWSVGIEEVVYCILPGVRGLLVDRPINSSDEASAI